MFQVQKVHLFLYINTMFLWLWMLVKVCKAMEDCEIIGMIFEIIGDVLFGRKLEDLGEVELDK